MAGRKEQGRARSVLDERVTDDDGALTQAKVWRVPVSSDYPEGVKYSLAFIPPGKKTPAVLYDNHRGKRHHKHVQGRESAYQFLDIDRLILDFEKDVNEVKARNQS